ncbi:STAS domain-containing protein [Hydrogenophilus thiooxidans]|uniref:STAS domain-containing protein n=1 Tax=Hydrogenophilus thiooxidans TaxID=2820326 RepID=UPI001C229C27|nr:STAS domain-containing protein [Hydrogenophilus thiooxidans]
MADGGVLALSGVITVYTAHEWVDRYPAGAASITVDAGAVTVCDSALIALLLAWRRRASREGATITVRNLPESALALANIYGVTSLVS